MTRRKCSDAEYDAIRKRNLALGVAKAAEKKRQQHHAERIPQAVFDRRITGVRELLADAVARAMVGTTQAQADRRAGRAIKHTIQKIYKERAEKVTVALLSDIAVVTGTELVISFRRRNGQIQQEGVKTVQRVRSATCAVPSPRRGKQGQVAA